MAGVGAIRGCGGLRVAEHQIGIHAAIEEEGTRLTRLTS